jgi:hypothetical protein
MSRFVPRECSTTLSSGTWSGETSATLSPAPALKPALVAAYRSALPEGKVFAERVNSEIDPGYLGVARAGYP